MATNYDVQFLRLLLEQGRLAHEQALACLRQIDGAQPPPTAFQLVVRGGLVTEAVARTAHVRVLAQFEQSGEQVTPVSREAAERGVSDERPARAADPSQRYFDLGRAGENLEGYGLGPLIAHGPTYSSYRGRGPEGEDVRILTLSSRFEEHPQLSSDVTAELRAWLGYRHPGGSGPVRLGRTHPRGGRPSQTVVVYPAVQGQTLREFLKEHGALPVDEALDMVLDLTELLAHAHAKGLRLGDLRSDGVIFDGERAQVSDLGLARANCIAAGYGRLGLPFGHPCYLAPEVLQEGVSRPTPASDVYALGILFYELICGQLPFRAADPRAVLEQHFSSPLPSPPPEVDFSSAAAGVVLRMTAKAVEERAQDASALVEALRSFRAGRPFKIPLGPPERPTGAGPISAETWTAASERAAAGEGHDWTESMIDRAPTVGPSELQPLASGTLMLGDMPQVSGRLPPRLLANLRGDPESDEEVEPPDDEAEEPAADETERPDPPVVIGEKLGRGAIGATYEGTARAHDVPVVLKVISRKFSQHAEILAQIKGDLRAATKLRHPNVVGVLDVLEAEGREVAVLERSSGKTLRALLKERGALSVEEAVTLVRDVGRALAAGVKLGLHHGDLRSDKVYVEATRARLADFGHARGTCLGSGLGKYGLHFGHPCYLAPEVLQQRLERPTAQTDLYALGILFYEVVVGRRPFDEPGIKKNLLSHLKAPLPAPPAELRLPAALGDTLIRLTAKDPRERIASVLELEQALDGCLEASMASADVVGEASGAISAVISVEEFDPMASSMGEEARAAWGERSAVIGRPRQGWSKEKIQRPQRVGPSWDAQATAGELYVDLEKALNDAVKETPQERKQAQKRRGERQQQGKGGGPKQALVLGGALVGVLVVLGGAAALRGGGKQAAASPTPGATAGATPVGPGPAPSPGNDAAAERERAAVAEAIADYERRGRELIARDAFAELFALAGESFSTERRNRPAVEQAVRALEAEALKKIDARLGQDKKVFEQLVEAEDLGRARRLLQKLRGWLPPRVGLGPLEERLKLALGREEGQFAAFGQPPRDADALDRALGSKLQGWEEAGRCYPNGGAVLAYRDVGTLLRDLQTLRGAAPVPENTPAGVAALKVSGSHRSPAVLAWNLPLSALAEGTVRVLPAPGAEVALLLGVGESGRNGLGVSAQGELVTLGMRGVEGASPVKDAEELTLTLRCQPSGRGMQVEGEAQGKATKKVRKLFSAGEVQGRCALSVRGEAWLLTLRVKALIDPAFR